MLLFYSFKSALESITLSRVSNLRAEFLSAHPPILELHDVTLNERSSYEIYGDVFEVLVLKLSD